MPIPGESVERAAHNLTRPGDDERVGRGVIGPLQGLGQPRKRPTWLRRALVEIQVVPRGGPGLDLTGELASLFGNRDGRHALSRLRVDLVGGDGEVDGRERLRLNDRVRQ